MTNISKTTIHHRELTCALICIFVFLGAAHAATACDYYASPNGPGNGLTESTPFTIRQFITTAAAPGKVLCLLDGTYQGASNLLNIGDLRPGLSGTSTSPITIRALNDGGVTIDAEFKTKGGSAWTPGGDPLSPLALYNNSWWDIEGINFKRGAGDVASIAYSHNNIFRRIIVWDGNLTTNNHVLQSNGSNDNLYEDSAFFGPGRYTWIMYNSNRNTCRRCWVRHEGSITAAAIGPKHGFNMVYNPGTNNTCENCLATWYPVSMPTSWTYTNGDGTSAGSVGTEMAQRVGPAGSQANPTDTNLNTKFYGSISYVRPQDNFSADLNAGTMYLDRYGNNAFIKDSVMFFAPSGYALPTGSAGLYTGDAMTTTNTGMDHVTIITPSSIIPYLTRTWSVTNTQAGTCSPMPCGGLNGVWGNTGAGADVCYRYVGGVKTTTKLWPWPMNDRIKAATAAAGTYTGPCVGCTGGRAERSQTDVQADIESILGTVPSECSD